MPSIASRLTTDVGVVGTGTISSPGSSPSPSPGFNQPAPILSPILRCPLPVTGTASTPDNLRQYYAGGTIPQYRLNPAPALSSTVSNSGTPGATGAQGASGPAGPAGGVTQIVAGTNVTVSPVSGLGVVTVNATGGGGGGGNPQDFLQVFMLMGG